MGQLLYSIEEVFSNTGYLFNQGGMKAYFIPLYQRGYKWKPKNVVKLLDDINRFKHNKSSFYCLQNITIVPQDEMFHVVDGQQRLTTMAILLNYLGVGALVLNKVRFPENSIRSYTNKFLNEILPDADFDFLETEWEVFTQEYPDYDHQDIAHIFSVYQSIGRWFNDQRRFDIDDFKDKILKHVKLIINRIEDSSSEEKIFGNLNSKRIPLDGADLVRAMIVTRVADEEAKEDWDVKKIVFVNELRVKIGWTIDHVNQWWAEEKVSRYFERFVGISSETLGTTSLFSSTFHPINLLYALYVESSGLGTLTLEFFEQYNNDYSKLYREVIKFNDTLRDWFQDREVYHLLGFLFFQSEKTSFKDIWQLWVESKSRQNFIKSLKERVRDALKIGGELADFRRSEINWYNRHTNILVRGLILMDVIHSFRSNQKFIPYSGFDKQLNDIEHIFPQNPEKPKDKRSYLKFLNDHVVSDEGQKFDISEFDLLIDTDEYRQRIEEFIEKNTAGWNTHSIGNLVLLNSSLNRSIRNAAYAVKRARIIEYFNEGNYIQPHTFHVFVRYYNDVKSLNADYEHWSNADIEGNANKISELIENFLLLDNGSQRLND